MTVDRQRIHDNYMRITERMARAAQRVGRAPEDVRLIAVTKTVSVQEIEALKDLGHKEFGENRVDVACPKIQWMGRDGLTWHFVGNIQSRKAPDVVELFDTVDAIDRVKVAQALERRCAEQDRRLKVLIEVNVSGEEAKHGFAPEKVPEVLELTADMEHLEVTGLMTMAPYVADPEETRPIFAGLRKLAQGLALPELSMGMTNDFEVAVEEGATQVRIGTALFE